MDYENDYENDSENCIYEEALQGRIDGRCPACGVCREEHRRECSECGVSWYPQDPDCDDPSTAPDEDLCADCAAEYRAVRDAIEDAETSNGVRRIVPPDVQDRRDDADPDPDEVFYLSTTIRPEWVVDEYRRHGDGDLLAAATRAAGGLSRPAGDLVGEGLPLAIYRGVECCRCGHDLDDDDLDHGGRVDEDGEGLCASCAEQEATVRAWWAEHVHRAGEARRAALADSYVYFSAAVTIDDILDAYPECGGNGDELTEAIDLAAADHGGAYWHAADVETEEGAKRWLREYRRATGEEGEGE